MTKIRAGIVGGTGYAGGELLRILLQHPFVDITMVTSRSDAGTPVIETNPSLRGFTDLVFQDIDEDQMIKNCDVVFFATPNGTAMKYAPKLLKNNVRVIDLSADFRIQSVSTWEKWYGMQHACPELISQAVYGLAERYRDKIKNAALIACPGCYATAVQLALLPLVENNLIDLSHVVADAKSGTSGAGKQAKPYLLFTERLDNFWAYGVNGHRHLPEIEQELSSAANKQISLTFVPHLVPMARGIEATIYAKITNNTDFLKAFETRYHAEPFVDVLPLGVSPETKDVRASNLCRLAVWRPQDRDVVVVTSVIDNLVKGAAGQAVQCMNIMCGFSETDGLRLLPVVP